MEPKITDFTRNGRCSRCGSCCSCMLPLAPGEYGMLQKEAARLGKPFRGRSAAGAHRVSVDMRCPFLDRERNRCSIYKRRPQICRTFLCSDSVASGAAKFAAAAGSAGTVRNLWEAFGLTGIALEGVPVAWEDALRAEITLDDGTSLHIRQGMPVRPVLMDGEACPHGMLLHFDKDGIDFICDGTGAKRFAWEQLKSIQTT